MSASPRLKLQLLGGFGLCGCTPSPEVFVISSKKARALLAYVAMQDPMQASREHLATLLWPDRVDRMARQNLRACVASLRRDLARHADELLTTDEDTVGLKNVGVDARQLRSLSQTNDAAALQDAAPLYRGQFLCDLALEGEAFSEWVVSERAKLDCAAGTILSKLASRADEAGDATSALEFASRLTAIDPFREDWLRLSLRIAARHRGRDKALMQAKSFIGLLKKELDVEPETETIDLIERIKAGRSYPLASRNVAADGGDEEPAPLPSLQAQPAPPRLSAAVPDARRRSMTSTFVVAAAVVLLIACLSAVYEADIRIPSPRSDAVGTAVIDKSTIPLVVSPFQSQTADTADFARELTERVLADVSRFSGLTVFDGRSAPSARNESSRVANELGAQLLAWGSVRRQGAAIRVNVGLTDTANQTVVWAGDFTGNDEPIVDAAGQMSRRIARVLQVQATYAAARGVDDATLHVAPLHQLVAKALTIQYRSPTPADEAPAVALYQEVLRRDRDSPLALIGLAARLVASSANLLSARNPALGQAEQLVKGALRTDPRMERAHYWLGNIYLGRGQRDLALRSFERALQLNPSFVPAQASAGFALVRLGRADEGFRRIENALRESFHDPTERVWLNFAGIAQLELGDDKAAIKSFLEAASLANPAPSLRASLASAYALIGQPARSREQFRLMKEAANPAALQQLLNAAAKSDGRPGSRYLQGLRLAAGDTL